MKSKAYFIGLDIGVTSVGYAVTDREGTLVKCKKKNMWGVRLFEEGKKAEDTRRFRGQRRRYVRRRNRIGWLQEIFAEEMGKADPNFFLRMKESFFHLKDRKQGNLHILFDDSGYTDRDYYRQYKNIYFLRNELVNSPAKADIRLVYLALHHIIKYRGNFLYEGQEFSDETGLTSSIKNLLEVADEVYQEDMDSEELLSGDGFLAGEMAKILADSGLRKKEMQTKLEALFAGKLGKRKELSSACKEMIKAVLGYKAKLGKLFLDDRDGEFAFTDEEEKDWADGEQDFVESMHSLYSAVALKDIMQGDSSGTISAAMIRRYEKHGRDLQVLKRLIKTQFDTDMYDKVFGAKEETGENKGKDKNEATEEKQANCFNYACYATSYAPQKRDRQEMFYEFLKKQVWKDREKELAANSDYQYIQSEMENRSFLELLNSKKNGAIPYQLHEKELLRILEHQGVHYPFLAEAREKIKMILKFRLPYYVGPLNFNPEGRKFAWMERRVQGINIRPWNFCEVVDVEKTAEKFISRMTSQCTYLPAEVVIPKNSLLYAEYEVLMELNKVRINGQLIKGAVKLEMVEDLFADPRKASVSERTLLQWLKDHKSPLVWEKDLSQMQVTGLQKEKMFASYQKSRAIFKKIFGCVDDGNRRMIEDLIHWNTVFEDKKILEVKIKKAYPQLTPAQVQAVVKLRFRGWSRLSRKLLEGIYHTDERGDTHTIMDKLRETNLNLMQLLHDKKLGFAEKVEEEQKLSADKGLEDIIRELPASPGVKRGVNQALRVVDELVRINQGLPEKIFIEFAREDGESRRSKSRKTRLKNLYEEWIKGAKKEKDRDYGKADLEEIKKSLERYSEKELARDALYLYYLQGGKCLYSGEKLEIERLSFYEVDHIIPQSYMKDDSLDNLALVKKVENQNKGDRLLLHRDIIQRQKAWWSILVDKGLISKRKYDNLTKETGFSEDEIKGFIHRQLVETRQITKHVARILEQRYPQSSVYTVKARLVSGVRNQYGLPKVREINDYHHAFDAYCTIMVGSFLTRCYANWEENLKYQDYVKYASARENIRNTQNGYFVAQMAERRVDGDTGEILWQGEEQINKLRQAYSYKDCFISWKTEEGTGAFFNQNISRKGDKGVPIKQGLDTELYGRYDSVQAAYFVVVEHERKNKKGTTREKAFVSIPRHIHSLRNAKSQVILEYLQDSGYENCSILKNYIKKYQKILLDGQEYYIVGQGELWSGRQLVLHGEEQKLLARIIAGHLPAEEHHKYETVYRRIVDKLTQYYPQYHKLAEKLVEQQASFLLLTRDEQRQFIDTLLKVTKVGGVRGDFKKFNDMRVAGRNRLKEEFPEKDVPDIPFSLSSAEGRIRMSLIPEKMTFIDTSVTGIFERRTQI